MMKNLVLIMSMAFSLAACQKYSMGNTRSAYLIFTGDRSLVYGQENSSRLYVSNCPDGTYDLVIEVDGAEDVVGTVTCNDLTGVASSFDLTNTSASLVGKTGSVILENDHYSYKYTNILIE